MRESQDPGAGAWTLLWTGGLDELEQTGAECRLEPHETGRCAMVACGAIHEAMRRLGRQRRPF